LDGTLAFFAHEVQAIGTGDWRERNGAGLDDRACECFGGVGGDDLSWAGELAGLAG